MRLRRITIRFRLVLAVMLVMAVATSAVVGVMTLISRNGARDEGYQVAEETAMGHAAGIRGDLAGAMTSARDLAQALSALVGAKANRATANAVMHDVITSHPQYMGVWTGWEPNAFDGRDAAYRDTEGHDSTGRFVPYWVWSEGKVTNAPMVDYDKAGAGDYYQIPKSSGREKIIDPYSYDIGGKATLLTTISEPIVRDGHFVGAAGVDLPLDRLSGVVGSIRPYGSGRAVLATSTGAVIAGGNGEQAGKPLDAARAALVTEAGKANAKGAVRKVADRGGRQVVDTAVTIQLSEVDTWVLVVTIPTADLLTTANHAMNVGLLLAVLAVLVGAIASLVISSAIVRPIVGLRQRLAEIAEGDGDLTQRAVIDRDDETGDLAKAFNQFVAQVAETVRGIQRATAGVGTATAALKASTDVINESAEDSSNQAVMAASAAEEVGVSVSTVSAGAEQMTASIKEIAQSAVESAKAAGAAVIQLETTTGAVAALDSSSGEIGEVLGVIASIAEQTNLLALNATIEAARAGEAGKGFAVVAGEVKDLAQETARATGTIADKIAAIRADTQNAVTAISGISQVIGHVNDYSVTIATAVEEQSATTDEMARAISEAATGAHSISESINGVATATGRTAHGTADTALAMQDLETVERQLHELVAQFKV